MANIRMRQGRYQAQVRRHGYPQATKTFTSITEAKKWVKATEIDMERQQFIPKISMTVREMLEKYEQICLPTHKGANTSEKYRVKMLKNYFGVMPLDQLTPAHLAKYRDARLKTVQPIAVQRDFTVLRSAITTAMIEWDIPLKQNPVSRIRFRKVDKPRVRVMSDDEEIRLLEHASPMLGRMIVVAVESAMRLGEICNIRKRDINFQNQTLHIPQTKTDKPRTIPLSKRGLNALIEQLRALGNVIPLSDTPLFMYQYCKPTSYRAKTFREFQRARNSAGITDLRFHDLRHTATTRLFERGLGIMEVASITGHEDLRMLKRYTHIKPESLVARLG